MGENLENITTETAEAQFPMKEEKKESSLLTSVFELLGVVFAIFMLYTAFTIKI